MVNQKRMEYRDFFSRSYQEELPLETENTETFPKIPLDLLKKFEDIYPLRDYPLNVTIRELMYYLGCRDVVKRMRLEYNIQNRIKQ